MLLIISAFLELILCALIFAFSPKKSHYETNFLVNEYRKNYQIYHSHYNSSYCDYFIENLKISKEINIIILCLSILLLLFVFSRIIISIYNKCKVNVNSAIKFIRASIIIGFIIIIGNILLTGFILYKIYKLNKETQDEIGVTNSLSYENLKVIIVLAVDFVLNIIQMCVSFKKYKIENIYSPSNHIPTVKVTQTNNNNYVNYQANSATTRSNIILVRKEKKYVTALRSILVDEDIDKLNIYIDIGDYISYLKSKYIIQIFINYFL
jgi:hypothetical protein